MLRLKLRRACDAFSAGQAAAEHGRQHHQPMTQRLHLNGAREQARRCHLRWPQTTAPKRVRNRKLVTAGRQFPSFQSGRDDAAGHREL